jgi:hypothetical protein
MKVDALQELFARASMPSVIFLERLQNRIAKKVYVSSDGAMGSKTRCSARLQKQVGYPSPPKKGEPADESSQELSPARSITSPKLYVDRKCGHKEEGTKAGIPPAGQASAGNRRVLVLARLFHGVLA